MIKLKSKLQSLNEEKSEWLIEKVSLIFLKNKNDVKNF